MATAIRKAQAVPPPPPAYETFIDLRLSLDEASTLRAVLSRISGSPTASRRVHTQAIAGALSRAGVDRGPRLDATGDIRFGVLFESS